MRKSSTFLSVFAAIVILASLCGCETGEMTPDDSAPQSVLSAQSEALPTQPEESQSQADTTESATGELVVTFEYEKQSGYASNQFAVWVEDAGGNFVKTLYATRFTANGGYKNRPDSIPTWTAKSGLAAMSKDEVDAITGGDAESRRAILYMEFDRCGRQRDSVRRIPVLCGR